MTDNEIKKALECCFNIPFADCSYCPLRKYDTCLKKLPKLALDLINRQQAEVEELTHKLECLLCHATGSKLSKSTYSLRTMELAVNDEVQECCEEAKAEAIKEIAKRLKDACYTYSDICGYKSTVIDIFEIDNLVKEMVGDAE